MMVFLRARRKLGLHKNEKETANTGKIKPQFVCVLSFVDLYGQMKKCEKFF